MVSPGEASAPTGATVLGSSFATLLLRGASFGVRVLCILAAARTAGPELFGTIAVLFTTAEVARVIADCGVDTFMLRTMATERGDELARSMGAAMSAKLVAGVVVGTAALALMFALNRTHPALNLCIGLLALTPLALNFGANYFIATRRTVSVIAPVAAFTATALAVLAAVHALSRGPTPLILVVAVYELALGAWLLRLAFRDGGIAPRLSVSGARTLARASLPLGIAIAVGYVYGKFDVFILDRFVSKESVGQYGAWSRILDPFLFVCGAIAVTAYGHLSSAMHEGDVARTRGIVRRYATLNVAVSGLAAAILAVGGGFLARIFLPAYASSTWMGQLLAVLLVLRSINSVLTALLQAAARRKLIMSIALFNFGVALIACVSLAAVAGVVGVIAGLLVMETVNFALQATFARRVLLPTAPAARGGS